jgi:hypothetical protein
MSALFSAIHSSSSGINPERALHADDAFAMQTGLFDLVPQIAWFVEVGCGQVVTASHRVTVLTIY